MVPSPDTEVEGVTTFSTSPATSYRYVLQLKSDKLSIWMEDRTSKKQWSKSGMTKADYLTSDNTISDASAIDYVKFFQDALEGDLDESGDVQRTFDVLSGDAPKLVISVKVRILRSVRVAKYAFVLDAVAVERIDVLESKLRDQQEELDRLRKQIGDGHMQLEASATDLNTYKMLWSDTDSDSFSVNQRTGDVSFRRPGVYSITATVNLIADAYGNSSVSVSVMKNQACIYSSTGSNYGMFVTASTISRFSADDVLAVTLPSCNCGTSYLYVVQTGN
ncbi:unnamed protein product [Hyaloperonospora brassicae]|uniref:PKD domain-containing protein n=1 Tax=Hyaloperonospora brassicae TaxID=162125 RepID=A0AAV0TWM9_HYABA|nr:unnamed protein product [Hyaloperonospora brassicae]